MNTASISYAQVDEEKLFQDLLKLTREDNSQKVHKRPRFKYIKNNFKARSYRSVLVKDAIVENLDGNKFYTVPENTIVNTQEISAGSKYLYLVPKSGKVEDAKYVTQGEYLNHLETILTFNDEVFKPFNREKFKAVEFDKEKVQTFLHLQAGLGSSSPNFFNDQTSLSATNFTLEAGVETFKNLPVFINLEYLSQNSGSDILFYSYSIGLRIEYRHKLSKDSFLLSGLGAQTSLLSSADILGNQADHNLDSFGANISYKYQSYILSLDLKKQTYTFDSNVFFPNANLTDENTATMISLSIAKEFEVAI